MSLWKPAPAPLRLEEEEVHLWRIDLAAAYDAALLAPADRERAAGYGAPEAGRRFAAARAALRRILGLYLEKDPAGLPLAEGPHRKPFLDLPEAVAFNLSHTGEVALLAFARRPVGVDIERLDRPRLDKEGVAARFFSPMEVQHWKATGSDPHAFFRIWTRKEAILKAEGGGWASGGAAFSVAAAWAGAVPGQEAFFWPPAVAWEKGRFTLFEIEAGEGLCAALAIAGGVPSRICYFEPGSGTKAA